MRCIDNCHNYLLDTLLGEGDPRHLGFYETTRDNIKKDGVTTEEVIRVLIHRITMLDNRLPCQENKDALKMLLGAGYSLEQRTKNRKERGVEGTHNV